MKLGGMEILGELSAGGMGTVLLARRTGPHGFEKIIAVKTIRPDLADREDIRRLFLDEARLAARIAHPAVTQVYDFGEDDGTLFLAMEHVQGVSLEALGAKLGRVPPGVAARIGAGICRGLHAAHETAGPSGEPLGVVHRDVSPPNVMLSFEGGIKILDFGIALMRDRRAPHTHAGRLRGKLAYMAPEQLRAGAVDRRTDVYGVATVLFELATGQRLRGELELSDVARVLQEPAPSAAERGVPAPLAAIIDRGLALDPRARYPDARAMAVALEQAAAALGGPSLEEFAATTLAAEQAAQKKQLAALTGTAAPPARKLRGPTLAASGATPAPEPTVVPPEAPRRRWALAGIALVVGAFLALSLWPGQQPIPPAAPPVQVVDLAPAPERPAPEEPAQEVRPPPAPPPRRERERPRAKAPGEATGLGWLTIGAHPYALVLVDDREEGLTPLLKLPLAAGPHRVVLLDPASRAVRTRDTITIEQGALVSRTYR